MTDPADELPMGVTEEVVQSVLTQAREQLVDTETHRGMASGSMKLNLPVDYTKEQAQYVVDCVRREIVNTVKERRSTSDGVALVMCADFTVEQSTPFAPSSKATSYGIIHDFVTEMKSQSSTKIRSEEARRLGKRCEQEECRRCLSQYLSAGDIKTLGSNYELKSVEDLKRNCLDYLTHAISTDFEYLHANRDALIEATSKMSLMNLEDRLTAAFMHRLTKSTYHQILDGQIEAATLRSISCHGILLPDLYHHLGSVSDFLTAILRPRLARAPNTFVNHDNRQVQLSWAERAVAIVAAPCHVRFDTKDTYSYTTLPEAPNNLHEDRVFTAARAMVILKAQAILYRALRNFAQAILLKGIPVSPSKLSTSPPPIPCLLETLNEVVLPKLGEIIHINRKFLPSFGGSGRDLIADVEQFDHWALHSQASGTKDQAGALSRSLIRSSVVRTRTITVLETLRTSLRLLKITAKDHLAGRLARDAMLDMWQVAEQSVTMLAVDTCKSALRSIYDFTDVLAFLMSHSMKWSTFIKCGCKAEGDIRWAEVGKELTPTLLWLLCSGWTMPEKARVVRAVLRNPQPDICNSDRLELLSVFNLINDIYNMLELIQPCIVNETDFLLYDTCMEPSIPEDTLIILFRTLPAMKERQADEWAEMLWKAIFENLEDLWNKVGLTEHTQRLWKTALGIEKEEEEATSEVLTEGTDTETEEEIHPDEVKTTTRKMRRAHLGSLAEPVAKRSLPKNLRPQPRPASYQSSIPRLPETCEHSHSRPSQFEEVTESARKPKRRDNATTQEADTAANPPIASPQVPAPKPKLIFKDAALYNNWRQIFPLPGTAAMRSPIKWNEFCRAMKSEPLFFELVSADGVAFRWKRAAREGHQHYEMAMHKPHGINPWIEKNLLKHIQKNFSECTGMRAEDFGMEGEEN